MSSCTAVYSCVHTSTVHQYKMYTVVQYISTWIYIYKVQCLCVYVCVCPVYMSCVDRSKVHQYKFCIVVQYICTVIYIYKPIYPWVCPVYMSCPFQIHRCGVRGRTWAFPDNLERKNSETPCLNNLQIMSHRHNTQILIFNQYLSWSHKNNNYNGTVPSL